MQGYVCMCLLICQGRNSLEFSQSEYRHCSTTLKICESLYYQIFSPVLCQYFIILDIQIVMLVLFSISFMFLTLFLDFYVFDCWHYFRCPSFPLPLYPPPSSPQPRPSPLCYRCPGAILMHMSRCPYLAFQHFLASGLLLCVQSQSLTLTPPAAFWCAPWWLLWTYLENPARTSAS